MLRAVLKFGISFAVLAISTALWWSAENEPAGQSDLAASKVEWDEFPVLLEGENIESSPATGRTGDAAVVFVYSPHQCYSNRNAMDGWHRAARQVEGVQAVNVLQDRGRLSARRYLNTFSTPYRTRLDSTGWFRNAFDLGTTPAVVLVSNDGTKGIFYPVGSPLSDEERLRHVSRLPTPTDS